MARSLAFTYAGLTIGAGQTGTSATSVTASVGRTLTFAASGATVTASTGSFVSDGYAVGMTLTVTGSSSNNGTSTITVVSALVLTVSGTFVNEGPLSATAALAGVAPNTYRLTGKHSFTHGYERAELSFEVLVQDDTAAVFRTAEAALLAAYQKPDQALLVVLSSATRHTYDPAVASNTGFNARANARIVPGSDSTANSARYSCTVVVELPATLAGRAGRRSSSVDVATSAAGRRTLTVSGVYTAMANATARAQFEAQVATYCGEITTALTGTWEIVGTPKAEADDQNKTIRFTRQMREVRYNQAVATLDHAAIVDPKLLLRRSRTAAGSSAARAFGNVEPLREVTADWTASIRFSETTDLDALIESTVRPFVLAEAERVGGGSAILVREQPSFDPNENMLSLSMTFLVDSGAAFIAATVEVSDAIDTGVILKPVWDGNPYSRDRYQGTASHVRTLTRRTKRIAAGGLVTTKGGVSRVVVDQGKAPEFSGFVKVRESRRSRDWNEGLPGGVQIPVRMSESVVVYVRADQADPGASATTDGGGGTTRVRDEDEEDAGAELEGEGEL